jgi:hypothetical protein
MHISCRTGFDATIVVLTLLSVICIVDAWLYTVVVCLVMKLQALLSTQKVALHAWGSLSFFFFFFFSNNPTKTLPKLLRACPNMIDCC